MVLKNAPTQRRRTDAQAEEEVSLLDRVWAHRILIAVVLAVVLVAILATIIVIGMREDAEKDAWFDTRELRYNAYSALQAGDERKEEEALRELDTSIESFADTSVHPWLLFLKARLCAETGRDDEGRQALETLRQRYPDHPFVNPGRFVPGDKPIGLIEWENLTKRAEFYQKFGKPFSRRPPPKAGLSATLKVKDYGEIKLGFFTEDAPRHAASFLALARKGFFDGTTFHRITDFCIQGGDPNSRDDDPKNDGQGGPGYTIEKEIFMNPALHTRGTLSAAATSPQSPDSGSQFFICTRDAPHLDGDYTPFGEVIAGLEVVDKIAQEQTKGPNEEGIPADRPIKKIVIEKVVVDGDFTLPPEQMPGHVEPKK